ncbi:MAG: methyltransferase family protein [Pseudomonadota bacterium]
MTLVEFGRQCFRWRGLLMPVALVLVLIPGPKLLAEPWVAALIGFPIAVLGELVRVATIGLDYIIRGGKGRQVYAERLVTRGFYNHTRNPMYFGNLLLLVGFAIGANSWLLLAIGVPLAVLVHVGIIAAEEDFLRTRFGADYEDFCRRVPRLIPNLSGLGATLNGMEFNWRRVVIKEFYAPLGWLSGLAIIVALNEWRDGPQPEDPAVYTVVAAIVAWSLALTVASRKLGGGVDPRGQS